MSLADVLNDARNLVAEGKSNRGGYVTLDQMLDECRRVMSGHGYGLTQLAETVDGGVGVRTVIVNPDDLIVLESVCFVVPAADRNGQAFGAALTFARRGSLASVLGITGGSDDAVVPAGQVARLGAAFTRAGITDRDERLRRAEGIVGRPLESSKELSDAEASKVIAELESYRGS